MQRPEWLSGGTCVWKSLDGETVIMTECGGRTYQHFISLDWADYDGKPENGRKDAEELATYICHKLNV